MDMKNTFLHNNLEEDIYMKQFDGFLIGSKEDYWKKELLQFEACFKTMVQ